MHTAPHPLAGQTVKLRDVAPGDNIKDGDMFRVEDWFDRVVGESWRSAQGTNWAARNYAARTRHADDDVVYGKVGSLGYAVHTSELDA